MALVWKKTHKGNVYEVRKAGNSLRLYTDGVFHSQWNQNRPLAGHLWDLLFLPALFHQRIWGLDHCVLLGLGGGAVINMFNTFTDVKRITAVDLDPIHLKVAKRFFIDDNKNVSLVVGDARTFIENFATKSNSHKKADIIIDDLFYGVDSEGDSKLREAVRAIEVDEAWLSALSDNLCSDGMLVTNFESENQMLGALKSKQIKAAGFASRVYFRHPRYENVIAVCFKARKNVSLFERNLARLKSSCSSAQVGGLRYELVTR